MSRRARVSRPVRTSSRSPRPTRAEGPCAAMVASRCSVVIAKPSGSSPSVPIAAPTSSSTPRPAMCAAAVWMPVTLSPSLVTTSPARRPFQALPWSKMWPRPSHWVEACSGMAITSSAPPRPCGKPCTPRSASVPVSSMVCTGLVRRRQPFCGPSMSKLCAREKLTPRRTRAAPWTRLSSVRKFSVPRTSSAPQRPQLEQRLAAAAIAPSGSVRSSSVPMYFLLEATQLTFRHPKGSGKSRVLMPGIDGTDTAVMTLGRLDLNLLVSLDALLQQRSVTRAAAQMGLSQPALSASLARLRRHFDDELLTRVGNDYRLTPLAVQLRELVRIALSGAERVFTAQPEFDPASSTREFSLLVSDYAVAVLGHTLATVLSEEAPRTRLRLTPHSPAMVERAEQVLLGADLMLLPHGFITDLSHRDLYRDEWVCVVSADNPVADTGLTVEHLRTLPWVVTYHGQTASTPAARQMRMLSIESRVQVVTENFITVPTLVAGSDRIAVLQRRLVDPLPLDTGIRALACPIELGPMVEAMWWHPALDDDHEHRYLRDVVARAAQQAVGGPVPMDALVINGADDPPQEK